MIALTYLPIGRRPTENPIPQADTIDKLRFAAEGALAMLAGMQLDVFTPLKECPKTAEEIADAIGVGPTRLRLVLYSLVAARLLTEQDGRFSNPRSQSIPCERRSFLYRR